MSAGIETIRAFESAGAFSGWLAENHAVEKAIWLKIYKKHSDIASVSWEEAVIEALAYGWIDGQKKSNDDVSWLQRFTPRKPKSNWSQKNCAHAERLIAEGRMREAGLRMVNEAKASGRWDIAYAGSADMELPADFLALIAKHPQAEEKFATLTRAELFSIYYRLHTAKTPETRQKRMDKFIADLARPDASGQAPKAD